MYNFEIILKELKEKNKKTKNINRIHNTSKIVQCFIVCKSF